MYLGCSSVCASVCVCMPNIVVNTVSWKILDIFSPNFRHWCILGQGWIFPSFGVKRSKFKVTCVVAASGGIHINAWASKHHLASKCCSLLLAWHSTTFLCISEQALWTSLCYCSKPVKFWTMNQMLWQILEFHAPMCNYGRWWFNATLREDNILLNSRPCYKFCWYLL